MKKMIGKALVLSVFAAGIFSVNAEAGSSNGSAIAKLEEAKANYLASIRQEAMRTNSQTPQRLSTGPASAWLKKVNANEVNMVTNRFEKKAQAAINLNGKTYYGTGEGYEQTLAQNTSIRFAKDPLTNNVVDKSSAVVFADASGKAYYFESENSFKDFIALATPETIYGYSEAK